MTFKTLEHALFLLPLIPIHSSRVKQLFFLFLANSLHFARGHLIHYLFLELQRVDAEREAHQQKIDELEKQKQEQIERIESEGDVLLELPGPLKHSSSHTSLSSTEVYREFESAEPITST